MSLSSVPTAGVPSPSPPAHSTSGFPSLLLPSFLPNSTIATDGSDGSLSIEAIAAAATVLAVAVVCSIVAALCLWIYCRCRLCCSSAGQARELDVVLAVPPNPYVSPITQFQSAPRYMTYGCGLMRQNSNNRTGSFHLKAMDFEGIYNAGILAGCSNISGLSEDDSMSGPPSPTVSSYYGDDDTERANYLHWERELWKLAHLDLQEQIVGAPTGIAFSTDSFHKNVRSENRPLRYSQLKARIDSYRPTFSTKHRVSTHLRSSHSTGNLCTQEPLVQKPNTISSDESTDTQDIDEVSCMEFIPKQTTLVSTISNCTSEGTKFTDETNDFSLEIPEGAIPEGMRLTVDVRVALFGPFQFPEGLRPVSPVFWVCVRDHENFEFSKPVTVTIPHFLEFENDDDIQSLGLTFLKADHDTNVEQMYQFRQTDGKMTFELGKRFGLLQTTHFCSLCIACRDSPECLEKTTFCITAVLPNSTIPVGRKVYAYFFVTFLNLKTCLRRVDELISQKNLKEYEKIREEFQFESQETSDPALEIDITQPKHGKIGVRGKKKVMRSEVDIFTRMNKLSEDELKAQENENFYPLRFRLFLSCSQHDATLSDAKIEFRGTTTDPEFDIYLDIPDNNTTVHIDSPVVDENKPLDIKDLFQVKSKLLAVAVRWKHIGLALGLRADQLDSIGSNNRMTKECLTAMATDWLNRAYDTEAHGEPTLQRLSEAVRNPAGGNNPAVAQHLLHNWTLQTVC